MIIAVILLTLAVLGVLLVVLGPRRGHHSKLVYLLVYSITLLGSLLAWQVRSPSTSFWNAFVIGGFVAGPVGCLVWFARSR